MLARYALLVALPTILLPTSFAGPPCAGGRSVAICLQYLNPFSANAYEWTKIRGTPPADTSVLCGVNGEFWSSIDGW